MNKRMTFIITTHNFAFGTSQGLVQYLKKHNYDYIFIQNPLFATPIQWVWGVILILWEVLKTGRFFDIYIGSNRLNAFVGLILKKLAKVKKVIYFSPDWVEDRFGRNNTLNYIYIWLDRYCVAHTDITWNSSTIMDVDPMMKKRLEKGYPKELSKKQIQVPDGTETFSEIPLEKVNKYRLGFVGHLRKDMGTELIIKAYPLIKAKVPQASCVIIGSGPEEKRLRKMAKKMDIEFTGYIGEIQDVYRILSDCAIALAPYMRNKNNISQFTDPGKVKTYLSVSLPVIITQVPQIAIEIDKNEAGIIIKDDAKQLAEAVVKVLKNAANLKKYRHNAYKLSKKYRWDTIFNRAFKLSENI